MTAPTDRDLIQRARRGANDAFGELVTRYQTGVFNVCYRILHERGEAEDMAQETFIRAHGKLGSFDIENINEVLTREGLMGWELVSTLNVGPMRPILLFLKKKC